MLWCQHDVAIVPVPRPALSTMGRARPEGAAPQGSGSGRARIRSWWNSQPTKSSSLEGDRGTGLLPQPHQPADPEGDKALGLEVTTSEVPAKAR
jgi:hypothetical protein